MISFASRRGGRVFLVVAALIVLAEVAGWVVLRRTTPYRDLAEYTLRHSPHELDPYRVIRLNPNYRNGGVVHDAQGFRRTADVPKEKPPNTVRIFLMGASTAYGSGPPIPFAPHVVRNDETLDARLEELLAPRFPGVRIEVINAAVSGYRVYSHWTYLNQEILGYQPDVVLFLDGHNDHYRASDGFVEFDYDHLALDAMNRPSFRSVVTQFLLFAVRHSYALATVETRVRQLVDERLTPKSYATKLWDGELDDSTLALYRRTAERSWAPLVRQNCRLLQDHGVRAVVMLQPELQFDQKKPLTPEEQRAAALELSLRPPGHRKYMNLVKPVTVEVLRAAVAGTGATFLDLTDPFEGVSEQVYLDFCHLNARGFSALARTIEPTLTPIVEDVLAKRAVPRAAELTSVATPGRD